MTDTDTLKRQIDRFVVFCTPLVAESPVNYAALVRGLDQTTEMVEQVYPQASNGEPCSLDYDLLDMGGLQPDTQRAFADLSAAFLLNIPDGPRVGKMVLSRALKTLASEIARGILAEDGLFERAAE